MRGILRGVLAAVLLSGCGGVESDVAVEEQGLDEQRQDIGRCDELPSPCTPGARTICSYDGGSMWCTCIAPGYWECA